MRIAHLLLTHKNPEQLRRLIDALKHPEFDVYVHLDKKADIKPFEDACAGTETVFIENRASIHWAGYGTIQATINGLKEIDISAYRYINVISGQDFPLVTGEEIHDYIESREGTEFMTCDTVGGTWPEAEVRMTQYHFINWRLPGKHRLEVLANKFLPKRRFPYPDYTIVGRANWFTVTSEAAKYMLNFLEENPKVVQFFKYSWGADEIIWATALYNSPFRKKIVDNLVYVDWRGRKDGHPKILTTEDLPDMMKSGKLFARKLDMETDSEVFNRIENHIKTRQRV